MVIKRIAPYLLLLLLLFFTGVHGQHSTEIKAILNDDTKEIEIRQNFTYVNKSDEGLSTLYFNDWNHAYSNKNTALAKRFSERFKRSLHLAKDKERGYTDLTSIVDQEYAGLDWERVGNRDIIRIQLNRILQPGESVKLFFTYTVKLPNTKFTAHGFNPNGEYHLKDWYLTPCGLR